LAGERYVGREAFLIRQTDQAGVGCISVPVRALTAKGAHLLVVERHRAIQSPKISFNNGGITQHAVTLGTRRRKVGALHIHLDALVFARESRFSIPSLMGVSRAMPEDDLLDQFLAEPSGQWTGAHQHAVVNRTKNRIVQQFRFCVRSKFPGILAALEVRNRSIPSRTNPSVKELLKNGRFTLALRDQPSHDFAKRPVKRVDQAPHSKSQGLFRGQGGRLLQFLGHPLTEHRQHQRRFGRPPFVQGGFADPGPFGNCLNGQVAHRLFLKQGVDRIHDDGMRRRHSARRSTFTDSRERFFLHVSCFNGT
jgi:hypothetical protein